MDRRLRGAARELAGRWDDPEAREALLRQLLRAGQTYLAALLGDAEAVAAARRHAPRGWRQQIRDADLRVLADLGLAELDLSACSRITAAGLRHLQGTPLRRLSLNACAQIDDAALEALRGLPLERLDLTRCWRITGQGLRALRESPLTALTLTRCQKLRGEDLAVLGELPLRELIYEDALQLGPEALAALGGAPLETLSLSYRAAERAGGCAFEALASFPDLRRLRLHCHRLDAASLDALLTAAPRSLEALGLLTSELQAADTWWSALRSAFALRELELDFSYGSSGWGPWPDPACYQALGALPLERLTLRGAPNLQASTVRGAWVGRLRELDVASTYGFAGEGLASVRDWPLERLNVHGCSMPRSSDVLEPLRGLPLRELDLSRNLLAPGALLPLAETPLERLTLGWDETIGDDHLCELYAASQLAVLDASRSGVTDRGLKHLRGLRLRELNLYGTQVTDVGMQHLTGLPLERLLVPARVSRARLDALGLPGTFARP